MRFRRSFKGSGRPARGASWGNRQAFKKISYGFRAKPGSPDGSGVITCVRAFAIRQPGFMLHRVTNRDPVWRPSGMLNAASGFSKHSILHVLANGAVCEKALDWRFECLRFNAAWPLFHSVWEF